jgi:hypothetical protein
VAITETLRGLGAWGVTLENIPQDLLDKINYFGHVAVHIGRVDYRTEGDAALSSSRYTGVVRKKEGDAGQLAIGGPGMAMWLGDEDQKGAVIETLTTFTNQTFENTLRGLLPSSGSVTEGTLFNIAQNFTGSFQYQSPREAIDYVCQTLGAVWRVNGNGTLDAGLETDLYVTIPKTMLSRKNPGTDMILRSFLGSIKTEQDVEDFTTRVLLLAQGDGASTVTADADIDPGKNPYKDVHGNFAKLTRIVSESSTDATNADARAQLQLNRFSGTRDAITLSSGDYDIRGDISVGDYLWVHDPDLGLVDPANEIKFRGNLFYPMKLQLTEMTTPLDTKMSIGYRDWNGVWYNLSDYFIVESGTSTLIVGGYNRSLTGGDGGAGGSRPVPDTSVPDLPTWATPFASSVYQSPVNGDTKAQVQLHWTRPLNVDGSTINDGDHYEIRWRNASTPLFPVRWGDLATYRWGDVKAAGGTWGESIQYAVGDWHYSYVPWSELTFLLQELSPSMPYEAQIRAVDAANPPNAGGWSTLTAFQTLADTIPPATPAPPSVAASKLAIQVTHELGRSDGGTFNLDLDMHHFEIHGEYEPNFTPSDDTSLGKLIVTAGMITGHVPVVGSFNIDKLFPVYFKVIAVDQAGNKSSPSSAVSAEAELIDDAHITSLTVSKVTAGTISADWLLAANMRTGDTGARVGMYNGGLYMYDNDNDLTALMNAFNGDTYLGGNLTLDGNIQMPGAVRIQDGFGDLQAELGLLSNGLYGLALRRSDGAFMQISDFIFGPDTAYVGNTESTSSGSVVSLPTFGPSITVYIPATKRCMIITSVFVASDDCSAQSWVGVTGASTLGPFLSSSFSTFGNPGGLSPGASLSYVHFLNSSSGLQQGYNTFTMYYQADSPGTTPLAYFGSRRITVFPY